ncbi:MAG: hypothetical protein ACUVS4_04295 [Chloroflexaceae bacterium]
MRTKRQSLRVALEAVLDLLDEGLGLYRRAFPRMLMLTSLATLPGGALLAALVIASDWLATRPGVALLFLVMPLSLPLGLYAMGAVSRAAVMAANGETVALREALALGPLRVLGMGCYGTVFVMVAASVVAVISGACFCIIYVLGAVGFAVFSSASVIGGTAGAAVSAAGIVAIIVGVVLIYALLLALNGAVYSSAVFALQPFVHKPLPPGQAVRQSLDLTFYRFGQNLLTFICASLVFGAITLAATLAIGALVSLPVLFLLGSESFAAQAITAAVWIAAINVALPLLPIWMALLYQRRLAAWRGDDLRAQIAARAPVDSEAG